jgi:hypothetical protein
MNGQWSRDPVRWAATIFTFVQAVVAVLLVADVISEVVGGVIVGIVTAVYAAVSELVVRPATVPRVPLEELAEAAAQKRAPPMR